MVGWATGTGGTVTLLYLVNLFLLFYMTDVLGISAGLAGVIIFASRLYDMFSDPAVGFLSDRTRSRWGRRRPWLFAGALVSASGCVAMFSIPQSFIGTDAATYYMVCALLLYFTGYTFFNVPYLAMPAEMTSSYGERTTLMTYRVFFVSVSGLVATAFAPWLLGELGGGITGFRTMSMVMAVWILLAMSVTVFSTHSVHFTSHVASSRPAREWLQTIAQNRPFLLLIGIKLLQLFSLACVSATLVFFVKYVLQRDAGTVGLYGLIVGISSMSALPLWARIAKGHPKHRVMIFATLAQTTLTLSWLLAGPEEPTLLFLLRASLLGFSSAGIILMGQALLPDVIEYDYRRTGERREGMFAALYSLVEKTSFAFAPLIIGPMLAYAGYVPGNESQSPDTIKTIYITLAVLPSAAYLLSLPLLATYDLTEEKLNRA
jgi:GPH family glycoside/pentoside/hexuronide:cation symporter